VPKETTIVPGRLIDVSKGEVKKQKA